MSKNNVLQTPTENIIDQLFTQQLCQQDMRACRPSLTGYPVPFLVVFSIIHIFFAFFLLFLSKNYDEITVRYDNLCHYGENCIIPFTVTKPLTQRLHVYYELGSFYQNHFRFRGSISYSQLYGKYLGEIGLSSCEPLISTQTDEQNRTVLAPCGLRAYYLFTDLFTLPNIPSLEWDETRISWKGEINHLYKPLSNKYPNESYWMNNISGFDGNVLNEKFIVWMRTAPTANFRKLVARSDDPMPAGQYYLNVTMNYPTDTYNGKRSIVFASLSWAGGNNRPLMIINFVLGGLYLLTAIILILIKKCPKKNHLSREYSAISVALL